MDNQELARKTGQAGGSGAGQAYKLKEVRLNGDKGEFSMVDLTVEKGEDGKYPTSTLGKSFEGVIIKRRWRLFKYEELPGKNGEKPKANVTATSEYDIKSKGPYDDQALVDTVVVFGTKEVGPAAVIKDKYGLSTQCVLYVYIPGLKEVVRVIVKPSALKAEGNPGGELGLFDYQGLFKKDGLWLHEWTTKFGSVYREDKSNPRKSYWAMTFAKGHEVSAENKPRIGEMVEEVYAKTTGNPEFAKDWAKTAKAANADRELEDGVSKGEEYPDASSEGIDPNDIPF